MRKMVLVTGGAGYIGAEACYQLYNAGYLPITFDNLSIGHRYAVKWGPLIEGDLLDRAKLDEIFQNYPIDAVMHFAALALVAESVVEPEKYYRNNVLGTLNLLESMVAHGVEKLVFSSSCATYGVPKKIPIHERHKQTPINPYGHTKLIVEQMLLDFFQRKKIFSVILRYFNAAGADLKAELGENHINETHLIPIAIEGLLKRRAPLKIFGQNYPTHDGTAVRDYVHIIDIASAHLKALEWLATSKEEKFLSVNLGTGQGFSCMEIVKEIEAHSGKILPFSIAPNRPGDPPTLVSEISKAKKILNWEPIHSDLKTIISSALIWHDQCLTKYR